MPLSIYKTDGSNKLLMQQEQEVTVNRGKRVKFTQVPNELIIDNRLSFFDRIVWIHLESKIDIPNWKFYKSAIAKEFEVTRDTIGRAFKRLEVNGWIETEQTRVAGGKFGALKIQLNDVSFKKDLIQANGTVRVSTRTGFGPDTVDNPTPSNEAYYNTDLIAIPIKTTIKKSTTKEKKENSLIDEIKKNRNSAKEVLEGPAKTDQGTKTKKHRFIAAVQECADLFDSRDDLHALISYYTENDLSGQSRLDSMAKVYPRNLCEKWISGGRSFQIQKDQAKEPAKKEALVFPVIQLK